MANKLEGGRGQRDVQGGGDTKSYQQPWGNSKKGVENRELPRMPHERDESASATGNRLDQDPVPSSEDIDNAIGDLKHGRKDTDRRGVPSDVPAPQTSSTSGRNKGR
jgi:hypothetical protein